jgi:hypothetical protein
MACTNKFENNENKFNISRRKDYGEIVSIDINVNFIKYYMRARFFLNAGPMVASTPEEVEHVRGLYEKEVVPFIEELDKALDLI